ncbi:MAG: hypothetical protein WAZ98_14810 [Cyclobacteriaceae bacterium]
MESILINVKTKSEQKLITDIAKRMGIVAASLTPFEKRLLSRIKIAGLSGKSNRKNLSMDEIQEEVDQVRAARYARKKN